MEKNFYKIEGYYCTAGKMLEDLQRVVKNIGEDTPCFYTITTFQDIVEWNKNTVIPKEIANEIIDNLWFYNEVQKTILKVIENELELQLKERNLTLDDFYIPD